MPRGSGKTTLIVRAAIWALLYGKSNYVTIVAADDRKAKKLLRTIKSLLRFNELLHGDFPEVCVPVRALQGQAINAAKQTLDGEFTLMDWADKVAQLPTVEGSESSGALIETMGVTAAGRGGNVTLDDGTVLRPSLVLIDDFQTRESAASAPQIETRLSIIAGDLAGMAGPGEHIAMLAAITVIYPDDAADRLLDRDKHPEWHGVRERMVVSWPSDEERWDHYAELRAEAMRADRDPVEAQAYYEEHRDAMDAGCVLSWPERCGPGETPVQHVMHLKQKHGDEAFAAEYQNEPLHENATLARFQTADEIAACVNKLSQGELPDRAERVVAAIDVQSDHLWFGVAAFRHGFGGVVLDYGTWPDQRRRFYTKRKLPRPLASVDRYALLNHEEALYQAIQHVLDELAGRTWEAPDGALLRVSRVLVDEGYATDTVHEAIRESGHAAIAKPAKGVGIKASATPMADVPVRKGEPRPRHDHWRERVSRSNRHSRTIQWDTNFWQTFLHQRLQAAPGSTGRLTLWGTSAVRHRLFGAHLTAMTPKVEMRGTREVVEWNKKPTKPDEDLADVFAMCCVAASEQGVKLESEAPPRKSGKRLKGRGVSMNEYLKRRRGRRAG